MYRFLIVLILAVTVSSCSKPIIVVEEQYNESQPKLVAFYNEDGEDKIKLSEEKYYSSGELEYTGSFDKEGMRHGEWRYYYNNGQLWSLGVYDHGKMNGKKEVYWPNGNLRYKGQFLNDQKSGMWTFYDEEGNITQEISVEEPSSK